LIDALAGAPADLLAEQAILAIEHAAKTELPSAVGSHGLRRQYVYGDTALSLFHPAQERTAAS
jgi:16S rRNA G966 N2-methylase RsmD